MTEYEKLLMRPEWKEFKKRILKAWGGGCEKCDRTDRPLHVHHRYYIKGKMPWEYPSDALQVLCDICHRNEHEKDGRISTDIRPIRSIRQVMVDYIESMQKKLKGNGK